MSSVITSVQNPTLKHLRQLLTSSKTRRDSNQYVAEGIHLVRSFLDAGNIPDLYVIAESATDNDEVRSLVDNLAATNVTSIVVADSLFTSLTSIDAPVGILIVFSPETAARTLQAHTTVALENVQDPGNVGTILRTAAAAGVRQVIVSPGCASPWSPKALRAGMGAQFTLSVHEEVDIATALRPLRLPILATTLTATAVSLYDADLTGPIAWVFGNEGQGVSRQLTEQADTHIYIPQAKDSVESLNVSAAVAVCLYEHYRQNN